MAGAIALQTTGGARPRSGARSRDLGGSGSLANTASQDPARLSIGERTNAEAKSATVSGVGGLRAAFASITVFAPER